MTTPEAAFDPITEPPRTGVRRAPYWPSLLVVLGHYATLTIAVVTGMMSIPRPQAGPDDCVHFGSCLSPGGSLLLIGVAGLPVVVGFLGVTMLVLAAAVSLTRSVLLAGTVTSWLCAVAAGLIWLAVTGT